MHDLKTRICNSFQRISKFIYNEIKIYLSIYLQRLLLLHLYFQLWKFFLKQKFERNRSNLSYNIVNGTV